MFTDNQIGILVGMLLGDACIPKAQQTCIRVWHSSKQAAYVEYKYKQLTEFINTTATIHKQSNKHYTGNTYHTIGFQLFNPEIKDLYKMFYNNRSKVITKDILAKLTIEGLALWYMDDGHCSTRVNSNNVISACNARFATYCSKEEAEFIVDWFLNKLDIKAKILPNNRSNGKRLYCVNFDTSNTIKLLTLIEPFIIPSMSYKILGKYQVIHKIRAEVKGVCNICGKEKTTKGLLCRSCQIDKNNQTKRMKRKEVKL